MRRLSFPIHRRNAHHFSLIKQCENALNKSSKKKKISLIKIICLFIWNFVWFGFWWVWRLSFVFLTTFFYFDFF